MDQNKKNKKRFYFPFYPGLWLNDIQLNMCSLQTQGAWIRLLCYMNDAEPYGYLIVNNIVLDDTGIKKLLNLEGQDEMFNQIWSELTTHGVIKVSELTGAYYSKRLVTNFTQQEKEIKEKFDEQKIKAAKEVISYINERCKKNYKIDDEININLIAKKLSKGFTIHDFKKVVNIKCDEWIDDEKMNIYLRPSTLFGDKFENYLGQQGEKEIGTEKLKYKPNQVFRSYEDLKR